jgi:hypothetical protein
MPPFRPLIAFAALLAALVISVTPAAAADRLRIDAGDSAVVALDASETAHIAWRGSEPLHSSLNYCRLPLGATVCDVRTQLTTKGDSVSRPLVVVQGSIVRVIQYRYGLGDGLTPDKFAAVDMFTSGDGGATFGPGAYIGTLPFADAASGPGDAVSLVTAARTGGTFFQLAPLGGGSVTSEVNLNPDLPYQGAVAVQDGVPHVVYGDALGTGSFVVRGTGDNLNAPGGWDDATPIAGRADSPRLASGPSGLYMLAGRGDGKVEVRKFDGVTFGAGTTRDNWDGEYPQDHLAQDPLGWLHMFLPRITASCCPLLYSYFDGERWASVSYPLPQIAGGVRSAFAANHRGIAVWHEGVGANAIVYALRIGPLVALALPPKGDPAAIARAVGSRVVVRIEGTATPPEGVLAADVCAARVVATLRSNGGKRLKSTRMRLADDCSFAGRIRVARSKAGAGPLKLQLKVKKSKTAKPAKRTYKLRVRRG